MKKSRFEKMQDFFLMEEKVSKSIILLIKSLNQKILQTAATSLTILRTSRTTKAETRLSESQSLPLE